MIYKVLFLTLLVNNAFGQFLSNIFPQMGRLGWTNYRNPYNQISNYINTRWPGQAHQGQYQQYAPRYPYAGQGNGQPNFLPQQYPQANYPYGYPQQNQIPSNVDGYPIQPNNRMGNPYQPSAGGNRFPQNVDRNTDGSLNNNEIVQTRPQSPDPGLDGKPVGDTESPGDQYPMLDGQPVPKVKDRQPNAMQPQYQGGNYPNGYPQQNQIPNVDGYPIQQNNRIENPDQPSAGDNRFPQNVDRNVDGSLNNNEIIPPSPQSPGSSLDGKPVGDTGNTSDQYPVLDGQPVPEVKDDQNPDIISSKENEIEEAQNTINQKTDNHLDNLLQNLNPFKQIKRLGNSVLNEEGMLNPVANLKKVGEYTQRAVGTGVDITQKGFDQVVDLAKKVHDAKSNVIMAVANTTKDVYDKAIDTASGTYKKAETFVKDAASLNDDDRAITVGDLKNGEFVKKLLSQLFQTMSSWKDSVTKWPVEALQFFKSLLDSVKAYFNKPGGDEAAQGVNDTTVQ